MRDFVRKENEPYDSSGSKNDRLGYEDHVQRPHLLLNTLKVEEDSFHAEPSKSVSASSVSYHRTSSAIKDNLVDVIHETVAELMLCDGRHHPDPPECEDEGNPDILTETERSLLQQPTWVKSTGASNGIEVKPSLVDTVTPLVVLRPHPIKTAPPIGDPGAVSPKPLANSGHSGTTGGSHSSAAHIEPEILVGTVKPEQSSQTSGEERLRESWCQKASDNRKLVEQRKKELTKERRRQQAQCAFPETNLTMPPASPRRSENGDMGASNGDDNGKNHSSSQQAHSHSASKTSRVESNLSSMTPPNGAEETPNIQPTPLFERFYTEEVQEIKAYMRMIETKNKRIEDMERTQRDLEARLEAEVQGRRDLEGTLEAREREWKNRHGELIQERDHYMNEVEKEKRNNKLLANTVKRTEQDIHRMLQRKVSAKDHDFVCVTGLTF